MKTKEFIITVFFIIILLVVFGLFPIKEKDVFQQIIVMLTFFVILPVLFKKIILKGDWNDWNFGVGDWKQGLFWSGVGIVVVGILFFIAIHFFNFLNHYTIPTAITQNYKNFLFYEFMLVFPIILMYDFFFRGFVMSTFWGRTRYWVIFIQTILFLILMVGTKSFTWGLVPYLINAPLAGLIVCKSKSLIYSTVFQLLVIIILDAGIVRLAR